MSRNRGAKNDRKGLQIIDAFRWIRPVELGAFLWPRSRLRRKNAEALVRKWETRHWIIRRPLPNGAGSAILLSERGAAEIQGRTGKDWGDHDVDELTGETEWQPPKGWKHELLQVSLLAWLRRRGYRVIPERILRGRGAQEDRVPDAIVMMFDHVWWCEVEHARKGGTKLRDMVQTLMSVAITGDMPVCDAVTATGAMLAFVADERDERGHRLNHASRVVNAIRKKARRNIPILLAIMHVDGHGAVEDVIMGIYTVKSDIAQRVLGSIDWARDGDGVWHGLWRNGIEFSYSRTTEVGNRWSWRTTLSESEDHRRTEREVGSGTAKTAAEAKRAAYEAAVNNLTLKELGKD
jgi:hypothetical protein